jgi:hypothetical protein
MKTLETCWKAEAPGGAAGGGARLASALPFRPPSSGAAPPRRRPARRFAFVFVAAAMASGWGGGARAAAPDPPWKFEEFPRRAVFTAPVGQSHVLAHLPAALPDGRPVAGVRAATASADRPCRVLVATPDGIDVLVDCAGVAPRAPVALYLVPGDAPPAPDAPFVDPFPVRVEIRRAGGHDVPPSHDGLRFLVDRQLAPPFIFTLPAFVPVESAPPNAWYQGGWERPAYVARLASWLIVPEAGDYVFALRDAAISYLSVDDVSRVSRDSPDDFRPSSDWSKSDVFRLDPGLHRIEILAVCEKAIRVKAGWIPPGAQEVEPIPASRLACGGLPPALRFESRGDVLHAAFHGRPGPAYSFRGSDALFTPVRLESLHAFWGEGDASAHCEWSSQGRPLGTGDSILAITGASKEMPVTLRIQTSTGLESTLEGTVPLPSGPSREYRVSGRLLGVPSVCYEDDPVRPELHVRSTASPGVDLEAWMKITSPSGETTEHSAMVPLVRTWGRLEIPARFAYDVAAIDWEVRHAGVAIASGRAVFHRAPYAGAPASLDGDRFLDASGAAVTFVAPRGSGGDPVPLPAIRPVSTNTPHASPSILFLDGFSPLGTSAAQDIPSHPSLRRLRYADLPSFRSDRRFTRLAAIADLETLRGPAVFVIAPDLSGLASGETLADFERRLAALAALVRDALGASAVLVTPPAGTVKMPSAAAAGDDPDRLVASVVVRVADATRATVADAYSLSRTSGLEGASAVSSAIDDVLDGNGAW